jgi:hypothetical protein
MDWVYPKRHQPILEFELRGEIVIFKFGGRDNARGSGDFSHCAA